MPATDDDFAIADVDVRFVQSEQVGDEFKVLLARSSHEDEGPTGILVVPDAVISFCTTVEIVRTLRRTGHLPATLVVGVGYRARHMAETYGRRTRDFTPTRSAKMGDAGGGAASFLGFIDDELKPFVSDGYGADTEDATYVGFSHGGLFGTYVLFTKPTAFRRYGLGSPSYWWDDYKILEREAAYADTHDDLSARVFISVGAMENLDGELHASKWVPEEARAERLEKVDEDQPDVVADAARMAARLEDRRYPGLSLEFQSFPTEYHLTAWSLNISRSLRYLFDMPR